MFVYNIYYFNQEDSEAEVYVSDGKYNVKCYLYPANMVVVNQCVNSIYGFDCSNIVRSNKKEFQIVKLSSYYAYLITAQVVDRNKGLVRIGMLFIYLDAPIPKDILNGNYVTFKVMRMDCVIN